MTFADDLEQHIADTYAMPIVHRCGLCDWHMQGDLDVTLPAYLEHRKQQHPHITPRLRVRTVPSHNQFLFDKQLEENLAGSRAQGAGGWETAA